MEKVIPISKKQHDSVNELAMIVRENQRQLQTVAATIVLGTDEDLTQFGVLGARAEKDGVYVLVLDVPDPPPAE